MQGPALQTLQLPQLLGESSLVQKDVLHMARKRFARRCEHQPLRQPFKQRRAQCVLELQQLAVDGRRGNVQVT